MKACLKRAFHTHLAATILLFLISTSVARAQVQLNIQPGVQVSWPTPNTTNTYHLRWSPPASGTWSDLVAAVTGDGTTHTNFDPVLSGTRQYQDLEIVPGTPRLPRCLQMADSKMEPEAAPLVGRWIRLPAALCTRFARTTTRTAARLTSRSISPASVPVRWFSLTKPVYRSRAEQPTRSLSIPMPCRAARV